MALFVDNAKTVTLKDDVRMPKRVADVVKRYRAARQRAPVDPMTMMIGVAEAEKILSGK